MNNISVEKPVNNLFKINGKSSVEKSVDFSFPYRTQLSRNVFHLNSTLKSTRNFRLFSLLNSSFTHFPHSLLLLLLNN
jgi:hypothetical protein